MRLPQSWPAPTNRRGAWARAEVFGIADELIARYQTAPTDNEDLLSLLTTARDPETGEGWDAAEIRDQVLVFLLAGHDTTAVTLTFALYLLGQHPEIQRRVHAEIDDVLGGRTPTVADVPALRYTTMVL